MTGKILRSEILRDSEAALRLMDDAVSELSGLEALSSPEAFVSPGSEGASGAADLALLPQLLLSAYGEIVATLEELRNGRNTRWHAPAADGGEVSFDTRTAAEMTAADMAAGVRRALRLVDALEQPDLGRAVESTTRGSIREELRRMGMWLQVQEDASHQLVRTSSALADLEERFYALVSMVWTPELRAGADGGSPATCQLVTGADASEVRFPPTDPSTDGHPSV